MNTVKRYAMNGGVTLEWECGLCVKGQGFSKKIRHGPDPNDGKGQVCKDPWVEKEADAKVLRQGITSLVGGAAGHCIWDPVSKGRVAGSIQRAGVQGHARKLGV